MGYERLQEAVAAITDLSGRKNYSAALVLGSGLGSYAAALPNARAIPYSEIPHFPAPRVEGHSGTLYSVEVGDEGALVFSGRVHFYEGWDLFDVVFGVRTAALAGCHTVLLTNAAGGVNRDFDVGDLVVLRDHINLTGRNPLHGPNEDRLGTRFPDVSDAYSAELRRAMKPVYEQCEVPYKEGVYTWFTGPSYETPAEIELVRRIGGDLVGMSTVPEAIALAHMGVRVGGISLVTNMAAGTTDEPLSHGEVQEAAEHARAKFEALLDSLLPILVADPD
ncbi:MAG: purine-nucleoside phosphorylase [Acidimicrobiia bacterium]|nr:purine-nucleoside phosphorylase [Acidimicrobiia bacterium]